MAYSWSDEALAPALDEMLQLLENEETKQKLLDARQAAEDNIAQVMEEVIPIAVESIAPVLAKLELTADAEGLLALLNALRAMNASDEIRSRVAELCSAILTNEVLEMCLGIVPMD